MSHTIKELIQSALPDIGLKRDPIPVNVRDIALDVVNFEGEKIWNSVDWDNSKLDELTAPDPEDGIITFEEDVDVIRAVRILATGATFSTMMFNREEIEAYKNGAELMSDWYENIADDEDGNRRVRIDAVAGRTYKVLALKRFVKYSAEDYAERTFPIDRAESVLRELIIARLQDTFIGPGAGDSARERAQGAMGIALNREKNLTQRQMVFTPKNPQFSEIGNWW